MTEKKINQKIKENLFSTDKDVVIKAIDSIKYKGNKLYIPILFELLNSKPEKEIEQEIITLLGTVKDKKSTNSFIRAVENEKYKTIRKTILTACWQNGLDFSNFLPVFIDTIINDDWEIAFEAFTIVDNLEFSPSEEIIKTAIDKIQNTIETVNEQKGYFLREILVKLS